ncbi:MAG: phage tail tape measure protein [Lachnospiraceae bacterium]|nr:phage tail tape measure protein [Lachnospiraceae bacterium]
MSGKRIKGITIEIDGSTTGLDKALKGVDSSLSSTQSSLKDVNRLLKLDPTNTELLQQKQKLLSSAVDDTSKRLESLKKASEDAAKSADKYDAWKAAYDPIQEEIKQTKERAKELQEQMAAMEDAGEIDTDAYKALQAELKETDDNLKDLQKQAKEVSDEFGNPISPEQYDSLQREIIETEQDLESLIQQAAEANTALTNLGDVGKSMESIGNSVAGAGKNITEKVTAPILGVGTAAVTVASDFDAQMSKVSAISGATGDDLDALRGKAREMGAKTKFSASEAGAAMEYMAMAGWKTGDMLDGVEGIMNLAAASGEDLATTSDIVTDALTGFGMTAADSGRFADVLAAASSNANTNVSMLGESFKYVAPVAGALGYSAEDTSVALGLMANSGIKASQAGTALRTLLTNMAKPTDKMAIAMEKLGVSLDDGEGNMLSLMDVMKQLRTGFGELKMPQEEFNRELEKLDSAYSNGEISTKKYNEGVSDLMKQAYGAEGALKAETAAMLAGKEGMSGLLAIVNSSDADFEKLTDAIYNSEGSAENMANTMQDNLAGQLTILKSQLEELSISFGEILMPAIRDIVSRVQEFVDKLNSMDDSTRENIIRIAAMAAAIGPLLLVVGTLVSKIGSALQGFEKFGKGFLTLAGHAKNGTGIFGKLSAAISGLSAPMVAIAAVVAALVGAFVHLWNTNEEFRDNILAIWDRIKGAFEEFTRGITERIGALGIDFKEITETISTVWNGFCELLAPVFEGAFSVIATVIETVLDVITGLLDVFIGVFTGDWEQAWTGVKEIFSGVWDGICGIFETAGDTLRKVADTILGWFGTSWSAAWETIKSGFESVWDGITSFFSGIWNGITSAVSSALETVKSKISSAWVAVTSMFTTVWNTVSDTVSSAWETIKNVVQVGIMLVGSLIDAAFQIITIPFRFIWENCKESLMAAWDAIKLAVSTSLDAVKNTIKTCWNAIAAFLKPALNAIKMSFKLAWEAIKNTVSTVTGAIKSVITNVFNTVKGTISSVLNTIKSVVSSAFNAIKTTVTSIMNGIKSVISNVWNVIKGVVTGVVNTIRGVVSSAFNAVKTAISGVMDRIKSVISGAWNTVKTTVSNAVNNIKNGISNGFNAAKDKVSGIFDKIKSTISDKINAAKDTVKTAIDKIKGFFNFSWSLPKLKMPHPKISGEFSLNPPSVPKFSIDWYKKAMDSAMVMDGPTIFGYDAKTNQLLAGGEAGREVVSGEEHLIDLIGNVVHGQYDQLARQLDLLNSVVQQYFPQVVQNMDRDIVLDDGALVGRLTSKMDVNLGRVMSHKERGN